MISINDLTPICDYGKITEASTTGFKLTISRDDFCYQDLKNINVDSIKGLEVSLYIPMMDLDITGHIARARYMKNNEYELGIDYTSDAPEFWRECLCDLLPKAG
jgi:hypothetical protein